MKKEEIIANFKQARSIKNEYKLTDDEMYFVNEIFELQKKLNQAPTGEKKTR